MDEETLAVARKEYAGQLDESVRRIREKLSSMPEVERISLFGSYAAGRRDLFTDLDVLVVMRTSLTFPERLARLYSMLHVPVDLDLLCYTPEELDRMSDRPFIRKILREEKVLYARQPA